MVPSGKARHVGQQSKAMTSNDETASNIRQIIPRGPNNIAAVLARRRSPTNGLRVERILHEYNPPAV